MIGRAAIAAATLAAAVATGAPAAHADDAGAAAQTPGAPERDAPPAPEARERPSVYEHDIVEVQPAKHGKKKRPIKTLSVDNPLGDVRIEGHDGEGLVIFAYKKAPDDAALDQLRVSLVPDPDGPVRISTAVDRAAEKSTLPSGEVRIDLVIRAPRQARVDARVGRGELVVRNMDAGGDLDAGAGAITVENVSGTIYARSVDGDQRFDEVFGQLDVQALAADLAFHTIRGDALVASVHDGLIQADDIHAKRIELRATRGKIRLESDLPLGGSLIVSTRHGDVDVKVRSPGALKVKAIAGGELALAGAEAPAQTDRDEEWVHARYGKGKRPAAVELRSKYGDVRFAIVPD